MIRALLVLGLAAIVASAETPAAKTHFEWRREAMAARQRGDFAAMLNAARAAADLQPDSPRELLNLARAYALTYHLDLALSTLHRLTRLYVFTPIANDPDLASVREAPEFQEILERMRWNKQPLGSAMPQVTLTEMTGIIEGVAYRPATDEYFFGDVHERCVWRKEANNHPAERFSLAEDDLLGVFKLLVDEAHGQLWISTTALPEMRGYKPSLKGKGTIATLDLVTGRVRHSWALPDDGHDHCLGDFVLASDGSIYATDSLAPVIWRLPPKGDHLEKFVESPEFHSLQGVGLLANETKLVVSDYGCGLFIIDLATRGIAAIPPMPKGTLIGLDTLMVQDGKIVAVQNGVDPQRVVRLQLNPELTKVDRLDVIAGGLYRFDDLTHLAMVKGWLMVIVDSGWAQFEDPKASPPPRDVRLMFIEGPR